MWFIVFNWNKRKRIRCETSTPNTCYYYKYQKYMQEFCNSSCLTLIHLLLTCMCMSNAPRNMHWSTVTFVAVFFGHALSVDCSHFYLHQEYILSEGNPNVIVCERGIRMYGASKQRSILDLIGLSDFKSISHLPIIVDPSHCTRDRKKVPHLAKAAMVYGCDGLMVEVHPNPDQALSDGPQSLTFNQFDKLLIDLKKISKMSGKPLKIFD